MRHELGDDHKAVGENSAFDVAWCLVHAAKIVSHAAAARHGWLFCQFSALPALTLAGACITVRFGQPAFQEETVAEANLQVFPDRVPQVTLLFGVLVREDLAFTDAKGRDNMGVRKGAEQALERLQSILPRVLAPGETVLLISPAQCQSVNLDSIFLGIVVAMALSKSCLVLTNRRLLRFRTQSSGLAGWKWDDGVASLLWGDAAEIKPGGFAGNQLTVRSRSGSKEIFMGLARPFMAKLKRMLPILLPNSSGDASAAGAEVALCPRCLAVLVPRNYQCPQCGQAFKDEKTLLRRTIVIPGGECFYVGHAGLGVLLGLSELILLVAFAGTLIAALGGNAQDDFVIAAIVFLFLLVHKLSGYFACRRLLRTFLPVK